MESENLDLKGCQNSDNEKARTYFMAGESSLGNALTSQIVQASFLYLLAPLISGAPSINPFKLKSDEKPHCKY